MTFEMPVIGNYNDVATCLKLSKNTIYKMTCKKRFARGIYLGQGRFSLSRLKECIEEKGTYLQKAAA